MIILCYYIILYIDISVKINVCIRVPNAFFLYSGTYAKDTENACLLKPNTKIPKCFQQDAEFLCSSKSKDWNKNLKTWENTENVEH